jgi:hypothetical protein
VEERFYRNNYTTIHGAAQTAVIFLLQLQSSVFRQMVEQSWFSE